MVDGIKGKGIAEYKIQWGKWFTIAGIMCAIVCFVVSAFVSLYPKLNITNVDSLTTGRYGPSYTFTQGFYNLKFFTNSTSDPATPNEISLSVAGIVMIVFVALSIIFPLIGFVKAQNKLFYKSANNLFVWFLGFVILMGILMATAVFLGKPYANNDPNDIFSSAYYSGSQVTFQDQSGALNINGLWLKGNTNYWILLGLTLGGAVAIIVFAILTTKKMFFRGIEKHQHIRKKI